MLGGFDGTVGRGVSISTGAVGGGRTMGCFVVGGGG